MYRQADLLVSERHSVHLTAISATQRSPSSPLSYLISRHPARRILRRQETTDNLCCGSHHSSLFDHADKRSTSFQCSRRHSHSHPAIHEPVRPACRPNFLASASPSSQQQRAKNAFIWWIVPSSSTEWVSSTRRVLVTFRPGLGGPRCKLFPYGLAQDGRFRR